MTIRRAAISEFEGVRQHYAECGYGGGAADDDLVVVAFDTGIAGVVRICREKGVNVLRGMQVKPAHQRMGLGSQMLRYLQDNLEMDGCYCLPYQHLKAFYGQIDFEEISPEEAPDFINERLKKYLSKGGKEVVIMQVRTYL
jgi:GNAT superfamily N-acetyltransferase